MSAHEEVGEQVHEAREPFDKAVAGTMAIVAALLAVVSVLAQHFNAEKLLLQQLASDQWSFYQGKDIRRYVAQATADDLAQMRASPELADRYRQDASKYKQQGNEIQDKAREYEVERDKATRQADHFHFGEAFLEIAIVLSSLAILTKRRGLFVGGIIFTVVGASVAAIAYWF